MNFFTHMPGNASVSMFLTIVSVRMKLSNVLGELRDLLKRSPEINHKYLWLSCEPRRAWAVMPKWEVLSIQMGGKEVTHKGSEYGKYVQALRMLLVLEGWGMWALTDSAQGKCHLSSFWLPVLFTAIRKMRLEQNYSAWFLCLLCLFLVFLCIEGIGKEKRGAFCMIPRLLALK